MAYIAGISYYLPEDILDNELLSRIHPEWSVEKISAKTGINVRHIAKKNEYSSDMAVSAANLFFSEYNIEPKSIDFLLFCTQTPDYFLPTTACIIHERLGLSKFCGALDFNLGCSGYIYGLGLAKGLVQSGQANSVLLITSETYSKLIHPEDKSNKTLFGDAAAVSLVVKNNVDSSSMLLGNINSFQYGTDGSGADKLIVKNGGIRYKDKKAESIYNDGAFVRNDDCLFMDGKSIFEFTVFTVPKLIKDTLEKNRLELGDIDLFIFHQANAFMLHTVRKRIGIPEEKFYIHLSDCGNTVSSTIPIAIKNALVENAIKKGNKVLIAGFGVGLSWGATVIQY